MQCSDTARSLPHRLASRGDKQRSVCLDFGQCVTLADMVEFVAGQLRFHLLQKLWKVRNGAHGIQDNAGVNNPSYTPIIL